MNQSTKTVPDAGGSGTQDKGGSDKSGSQTNVGGMLPESLQTKFECKTYEEALLKMAEKNSAMSNELLHAQQLIGRQSQEVNQVRKTEYTPEQRETIKERLEKGELPELLELWQKSSYTSALNVEAQTLDNYFTLINSSPEYKGTTLEELKWRALKDGQPPSVLADPIAMKSILDKTIMSRPVDIESIKAEAMAAGAKAKEAEIMKTLEGKGISSISFGSTAGEGQLNADMNRPLTESEDQEKEIIALKIGTFVQTGRGNEAIEYIKSIPAEKRERYGINAIARQRGVTL